MGDDLTTAVSIALAESGSDPQAYNPERAANTPQGYGSFGLWQIYLNHPEFQGQNLTDPQVNAAAAYAVYAAAGHSFRPWSTFGNGAYLAHVDAVNAVIGAAQDQTAVADNSAPAPVPDTATAADTGSNVPPGTPSTGDLVGLAVGGALALWAAFKLFG